ncbi:FAD:protein FMN transferase [Streptomyces sp. NPDC087294]|uniref:FAD:protein FMN transferase n=1 Tax=Streptomyces sp. NPDC087294 TaxID=3365777 RepID=UPI00381C6FC2
MTSTAARVTAAADWRALGTAVRLVVTDPAMLETCNLLLACYLAEVDAACSRFRDDSELVALDAAQGRPVRVSPLLAEALALALDAAEQTDGAVDLTVGSAMEAIGYDRDFTLVQEDDRPVRLTVRRVPGWRSVRLDRTTGTVTVPPGVRLDLGATAKAWAADRAAAMLAATAGCGVLVSLGGDTAVAGEPPAGGWQIRVQDVTGPVDEEPEHGSHTTVGLHTGGLATSGTAARHWHRDGQALHHILDPHTGLPAPTPWRTVSVAAPTCAEANTASTAALIKAEHAPHWLTTRGFPARLVTHTGKIITTPGWPTPASSGGFEDIGLSNSGPYPGGGQPHPSSPALCDADQPHPSSPALCDADQPNPARPAFEDEARSGPKGGLGAQPPDLLGTMAAQAGINQPARLGVPPLGEIEDEAVQAEGGFGGTAPDTTRTPHRQVTS